MTRDVRELRPELRQIVKRSGALLGEVIRRERGEKEYRRIEMLRREMAALRGMAPDRAYLILSRKYEELKCLSRDERQAMAHAFALLLELMNACENAYRTYRLRRREPLQLRSRPEAIISVLTAHPTEARSPENVEIFHRIQTLLTEALEKRWADVLPRLRHALELVWRISIARNRRPTVEDEAEYLYSILLKPEILEAILKANEEVPFYFRSWVGGDKDGHPGVNEQSTLNSLNCSRLRLHDFTGRILREIRESVELLSDPALESCFRGLMREFRSLKTVGADDARRIRRFRTALREFSDRYREVLHLDHPDVIRLERLIRVFPALVIPLELREGSDEILDAVRKKGRPIERMLNQVRRISRGGNPRWYARGLVISMTRDFHDIQGACRLVERTFGDLLIPVIPLFEQAAALESSSEIVGEMLGDRKIRKAIPRQWNGFLEVMLGYSDSAKEAGVLPSRLEIREAVYRLDAVCRKAKIRPLFFHGSGGSVDRGGGSIEEQTAWWPASALARFKVTVQGEMVERSFSTPEITQRQMQAVAQQWANRKQAQASRSPESSAVRDFSARVSASYRAQVASPAFLEMVERATPYSDLQKLRIGSRPSKRSKALTLSSLRAIPWVLCWTQTRTLFPTWWGVGTAWKEADRKQRAELKRAFELDPLFRSYVKLLGFTLAKVELPVWRLYLEHSGLSSQRVDEIFDAFVAEYRLALQFTRTISGHRNLLWFRSWLGESIRLRSPMIHPLNLLQISNRDEPDVLLTRETVTGISSGMQTTG